MKNSKDNYYSRAFSHLYIEEAVKNHPLTEQLGNRFLDAQRIVIRHYKDVFCRRGQDFGAQKRTSKIILAKKMGQLIYEGAPVCQNFGNSHFYYTSCVMNCPFDCEYCYLQGMYPSANIVIFVNLEDVFVEVDALLKRHPVYLCVSYDTDLLALEGLIGYVSRWMEFASARENLTLEIRTKSAYSGIWECESPLKNVIFAFTLSPEEIACRYEHHTPSLYERIKSIQKAMEKGFLVRLCFDPMIYVSEWRECYAKMFETVLEEIDIKRVRDISLGLFRVSQDYMKKMKKIRHNSAVIQFPYQNEHGVYQYPSEIGREMIAFMRGKLEKEMPSEKIFIWESVKE